MDNGDRHVLMYPTANAGSLARGRYTATILNNVLETGVILKLLKLLSTAFALVLTPTLRSHEESTGCVRNEHQPSVSSTYPTYQCCCFFHPPEREHVGRTTLAPLFRAEISVLI